MSRMAPPNRIRVLIVDDHAMVREGLTRQLEAAGIEVIASCGTAAEAVELAARHEPEAVLLDYDLGAETGAVFLAQAARRELKTAVLVVTAWIGDSETQRLVGMGAMGVILKREPAERLVQAVRSVAAGEPWFDQKEVLAMVTGRGERSAPGAAEMSIRERNAIRYLLQGQANKEIARQMGISESAVKAILQRLFERAGVRSRAQLVRVALERGWN
jgi:two-component system nitrate/nitrite response regulator NarL